MASCLILQHVGPEGPYAIADALCAADVEIEMRRTHLDEELPANLDGVDGLVVMGGPMSSRSDDGFPTRSKELKLLEAALEEGLPVLGVCLGAQLLAMASGGQVIAGRAGQEIGWGDIDLHATVDDDVLFNGFPSKLRVLHWHGETYDLPSDAVSLASSAVYPEQAFRIGQHAWGLQFHLEVDALAVNAFINAFGSEASDAGVEPTVIRAQTTEALDVLEVHRNLFLARFANVVRGIADAPS